MAARDDEDEADVHRGLDREDEDVVDEFVHVHDARGRAARRLAVVCGAGACAGHWQLHAGLAASPSACPSACVVIPLQLQQAVSISASAASPAA